MNKKCLCGATATTSYCGEGFCATCAATLCECSQCGHGGTAGDFRVLFEDEVFEVCPLCGTHDSAVRLDGSEK